MSSLEGLSHPAPQPQARRTTSSHNSGDGRLFEGNGWRGVGVFVRRAAIEVVGGGGSEGVQRWMIMWKCTKLFINTRALQLHMLAPHTHTHTHWRASLSCHQSQKGTQIVTRLKVSMQRYRHGAGKDSEEVSAMLPFSGFCEDVAGDARYFVACIVNDVHNQMLSAATRKLRCRETSLISKAWDERLKNT